MHTMRWAGVAILLGCAADSGESMGDGTTDSSGSEAQAADDDGDPADAGDDGTGPSGPAHDGDDDGAEDADSSDDDAPTTSADDGVDTGSPSDDGGPVADPPPTDADALLAWLSAGTYLDWNAESGPHPSAGPHFGTVRTFVDDTLHASLQAGNAEHPVGAAAVKELFGNGAEVRGWSVMVKVALGAGDDGWYWYEVYDDTVYGDGVGDGTCTGCHGSGNDYVRTPFPLQ